MKSLQNHPWINSKNIVLLLLGAVVMYGSVTYLVDSRFREIESSTKERIASQESLLTAIAETTARNGADAVTESIVKDCVTSERVRFDDLLGKLNSGLDTAQLIELERLFGRCGSFFSERKSVMVTRLSREITIYEEYVQQLGVILNQNLLEEYAVNEWNELADFEQQRSDLFAELVTLQDNIITQLLAGSTIESPEITEILLKVNSVQDSLVIVNSRTSDVRSRLIPL